MIVNLTKLHRPVCLKWAAKRDQNGLRVSGSIPGARKFLEIGVEYTRESESSYMSVGLPYHWTIGMRNSRRCLFMSSYGTHRTSRC
ncbi:hypothetical protein B5X24_HaOG205507 [Helicoverpa armigera]|nr:hypothetical protein B5X24_HaOG205507 [Helicoverpa armigera]